jgi:hypothetical protein
VEKGITTMDVNQCPTLEADIVYQMIKLDFAGKPHKKAIYVAFRPYDKATLDKKSMIPWKTDDYIKKRDAKAFKFDINDPVFRENPDYK